MELETNHETPHALDQLLRQAIHNNGEALDELFSRYRRPLYNTALRLLGNAEDAEDALQDGLLAAFRNLSGFKGRCQLSTWLTRIVINAALMRRRRIRPELATPIKWQLEPREEPLADTIPDPGPSPEEMYARQEQLQMLEQTVRGLPAPYRQAVWLCDVQGASTKEAAAALGMRIGTLKSNLHRARLRLGKQVAQARPAQSGRGYAAITPCRPSLEFTEKLTQPAP